MALSSFVMGACTFLLGVIPFFGLYMFIMGVFGLAMPFFNTPSTVLLQEKVEEAYLGRVFGVFGMIASSMVPLSMLMFGPLSDIIKIEWMLIGTGTILFLLRFFLIKSKTLVEAVIKILVIFIYYCNLTRYYAILYKIKLKQRQKRRIV